MSKLFFEMIPNDASIDFMGKRKIYLGISVVTLVLAFFFIFTRGFNYAVDFKGGTQLQIRFKDNITSEQIRQSLTKLNLEDAVVQDVGEAGKKEFIIRVANAQTDYAKYTDTLTKALPNAKLRFAEDRMYAKYDTPQEATKLAAVINQAPVDDLHNVSVMPFGRASDNEYMFLFEGLSGRIVKQFEETFGKQSFEVLQIDQVGPKVGGELRQQALGAVLISILLILIYVWFRFEFDFAPGAVFSLAHDAVIILGVFAFFQFPFDLSIVAAVLTIVGFSINDTIVVYDRIRENLQKTRNPDLGQVMNDSINQTLSRTILTSGTVLLASLALVFFGGPVTYYFSLAFSIGVIIGTFSSISVAASITLIIHNARLAKKTA